MVYGSRSDAVGGEGWRCTPDSLHFEYSFKNFLYQFHHHILLLISMQSLRFLNLPSAGFSASLGISHKRLNFATLTPLLHPPYVKRDLIRQTFCGRGKLRAQQFFDIIHAVDNRIPVRKHALSHRLYASVKLQITLQRLHII